MSDGAFPIGASLTRRSVCLRPSCSPLAASYSPYCAEGRCALEHRRASGLSRSTPGALAPVRVILSRSITAYMAPSAPLAGTSRLHRYATYTRCLRCASMPRRPASGSVLSLCVPCRHAVLYDHEESVGCVCSVPSPTALAFTEASTVRHSQVPPSSASDGTLIFAGSPLRYSLRPVELLASLGGSERGLPQPTEAFTPGLPMGQSPFPSPGITTVATEQVPPAGLSPTGTSASIAAPSLSTDGSGESSRLPPRCEFHRSMVCAPSFLPPSSLGSLLNLKSEHQNFACLRSYDRVPAYCGVFTFRNYCDAGLKSADPHQRTAS